MLASVDSQGRFGPLNIGRNCSTEIESIQDERNLPGREVAYIFHAQE